MFKFKDKIIDVLIESNKMIKNIKVELLETKKDIVTAADIEIGEFISQSFLSISNLNIMVETEEHSKQINYDNGIEQFYIVIDDIDGTDNYYRGNNMLPYCSLIVVFQNHDIDKHHQYKFSDIISVGCIEHTSGKTWYCETGLNTVEVYDLNKKIIVFDVPIRIYEQGNKPLIITDIVSTDISKLENIFKKCWVKDFGCSAAAYCYIGSKLFDGYISSNKKAHELGLLYLFCTETNQILCDFNLELYDDKIYDFNSSNYTVISGDEVLVKDLAYRLKI